MQQQTAVEVDAETGGARPGHLAHRATHHQPPEARDLGTQVAELAAVLARLRQIRAQLADCGLPLGAVLAETDRVIGYGAWLVALAEEATGPPATSPNLVDKVNRVTGGGHRARPSSYPPARQGGRRQLREGRVVDTRRRDFVVSGLLLLTSLAALVVVATTWVCWPGSPSARSPWACLFRSHAVARVSHDHGGAPAIPERMEVSARTA